MSIELKQAAQQALKALENSQPHPSNPFIGLTKQDFIDHEETIRQLRNALQQAAHTTQTEVTDEQIAACVKRASTYGLPFVGLLNPGGTPSDFSKRFTAEILALRPERVPMTDELFDLICNAIDKADTITMEGDYMLDSDDCIAVVRVMQVLLSVHHGITAQAKKEGA